MTDNLEFPYRFEDLKEDEEILARKFIEREIVRVSGTRYTVMRPAMRYAAEIYNFKPRPDDIWLTGFPRSGTTMTQEILYLIGTDLNYEKAAENVLDFRFPFLESVYVRPDYQEELHNKMLEEKRGPRTQDELEALPSHQRLQQWEERRFIKSHQSFSFLHPDLLNVGCKVVYIARNIKDCFISSYFFPLKIKYEDRKDELLHDMLRVYKKDLCLWGHYFLGLKEAWQRRNNENLLFLFYEEVIANKKTSLQKIANFLGKNLTEDQLDKLLNHISVDNFKKNKSVNNDHMVEAGFFVKNEKFTFIGKGGSGGWRKYFSKEMNEEFNEWIKEELDDIPEFEMPQCWKDAMDL